MTTLAVFASGNGTNFAAIMAAIQAGKLTAQVALLVCDQADAPVLERARQYHVPVLLLIPKAFTSKAAYERTILRHLRYYQVDYVILAGYMRLIATTLLTAYPKRILNVHPAYLPEFPGKQGILDAYQAGAKETGVTVHLVDDGVDSGPILAQVRVPIYADDSLAALEARIHGVEHELYPRTIQTYISQVRH